MVDSIDDVRKSKVQSNKQVKHRKCKDYGVTKKEFFKILDKASQPIKQEVKSVLKTQQT